MFLALGVVSCSSCSRPKQTPLPSPNPSVNPTSPPVEEVDASDSRRPFTINYSKLEVSLPNSDWRMARPDTSGYVYLNSDLMNVVVLTREKTTESSDQYILTTLRSIKDAGNLIVSTKQVVIRGRNYSLIESRIEQDAVVIFLLVAVDDGLGYSIGCGGPMKADQQNTCATILGTAFIK